MPLGRTRIFILLFTASVLAAVVTFIAFDLWRRHQRAIEAAETRAASLAAAAAEYARGSFALADGVGTRRRPAIPDRLSVTPPTVRD